MSVYRSVVGRRGVSIPARTTAKVKTLAQDVAIGLCLSALVKNPDQANTLLPYVLIPQIILGGGVLSVKSGVLLWLAMLLSPAYWAFRAARTGETELPADFPMRMDYDDSLWIPCAVLLAQTVIMLLATAWLLRRKDLRRE